MKRKLISVDEAKPLDVQITKPCTDCPFLRDALPGWLGGATPDEYVRLAHSEARIDCHAHIGPQCAGAAIYRANVLKLPGPGVLALPKDKEIVFASPVEFLAYHRRGPR